MFKAFIYLIIILFISLKSFSYENIIFLSSTTSTYDSGLLDYLNQKFKKKYNITVKVLAQGTGQALRTGKEGNVELILVHHKKSELKFMQQGYGLARYELMYNDYILVGPKSDTVPCHDINIKLKEIFTNNYFFISRGDDSGTHKKELELLFESNIDPYKYSNSYLEVGQGMGNTLLITNEKFSYTLSDRATWLSFNHKNNLKVICESQPPLLNQYGLILINPKVNEKLNIIDAKKYIDWLLSDEGRELINNFKINDKQLFFYNYLE